MDDTPRQFVDELKFAIVGRRIGQIALAVVLAEECIRYLNALVWYLIVPAIANVLKSHTESVLFQSRRGFVWEPIAGATIELMAAVIFVFYVNRWIYGRNRPRTLEQRQGDSYPPAEPPIQSEDYEPIVPRALSAPEAPTGGLAIVGSEHRAHPTDEN